MGNIRLYTSTETGHKALEYAAALMNDEARAVGCAPLYSVGNTYFDYGQDWRWTTILYAEGTSHSFQALYPAEHERIINGDFSNLQKVVNEQIEILARCE